MKYVVPTTRYKKDLKRYRNNTDKLRTLKRILDLLREEQNIPNEFKPHYLKGEYIGCLECHIENDFLLIWRDEENDIIKLIRLGSHSELFK